MYDIYLVVLESDARFPKQRPKRTWGWKLRASLVKTPLIIFIDLASIVIKHCLISYEAGVNEKVQRKDQRTDGLTFF